MMADPFEFWRLAVSAAMTEGAERFAEAVRSASAASERRSASAADVSALPTLGQVRLELATMLLLEERAARRSNAPPTLIVAPYAIHEASIADFAVSHSLAAVLAEAGGAPVALTYWKSAAPDMRDYDIDAYLVDLNVAVDDLGGRAALVGLCQGGWLAAAYAARFPAKVAKLVLAGAPVHIEAAPSRITRALTMVPPAAISGVLAANGGRVLGGLSFSLWSDAFSTEFNPDAALQGAHDPATIEAFREWNRRTVDLPGAYFAQTAEWIFRENRLARGAFRALGRIAPLTAITAPIFVLAAADDEVVSLPQAIAIEALCRRTRVTVRVVPGRHLSLFMGRRTIADAWGEIARWLGEGESAEAGPAARTGRPVSHPRTPKPGAPRKAAPRKGEVSRGS